MTGQWSSCLYLTAVVRQSVHYFVSRRQKTTGSSVVRLLHPRFVLIKRSCTLVIHTIRLPTACLTGSSVAAHTGFRSSITGRFSRCNCHRMRTGQCRRIVNPRFLTGTRWEVFAISRRRFSNICIISQLVIGGLPGRLMRICSHLPPTVGQFRDAIVVIDSCVISTTVSSRAPPIGHIRHTIIHHGILIHSLLVTHRVII